MAKEKEFAEMEEQITEELCEVIGDLASNPKGSIVNNIQPPNSVVQAMAEAAAKVLIAFEHGYRMSGE